MTANSKVGRQMLNRLADALTDDILNMTDDEITAEFRETLGDPDSHAAKMQIVFERAVITANKDRLVAAKKAAAASRNSTGPKLVPIDIAEARRRLEAIRTMQSSSGQLTLAARNESELSDDDILSSIDDLRELGVLDLDDESGETK